MDTVGAWLVHKLARDRNAEVTGANEEQASLLEQVAKADQPVKVRPDRTPPLYRVLGKIGDSRPRSRSAPCSACSASSARC